MMCKEFTTPTHIAIFLILLMFANAPAQDRVPEPLSSPSVSESPVYLHNVREAGFVGSIWSTVTWYLLWNPRKGMTPLYAYDFLTICSHRDDPNIPAAIIGDRSTLEQILSPERIDDIQLAIDPETGRPFGAILYNTVLAALETTQKRLGASCDESSDDSSGTAQSQLDTQNWFIASTQPFPGGTPARRFVADSPQVEEAENGS